MDICTDIIFSSEKYRCIEGERKGRPTITIFEHTADVFKNPYWKQIYWTDSSESSIPILCLIKDMLQEISG